MKIDFRLDLNWIVAHVAAEIGGRPTGKWVLATANERMHDSFEREA